MVAFPGCKINLGLYVTGKRPDGYHDIETCFYPVAWSDTIEVIPSKSYALHIPGSDLLPDDNNTCSKAFRLLEKKYGIGPVKAWLLKAVPHGAGLGGGSADGAAMLKLLNDTFHLGLETQTLEDLALQLGSDCPFFIRPAARLARGKGELFEDIRLSLKGYHIKIIKVAASINTAEAYRHVQIGAPDFPLREVLEHAPVSEWRGKLFNAFEPYAFSKIPELKAIVENLYQQGALFAGMSGSGSAVFGIFESEPKSTGDPETAMIWTGQLS